MKMDERILCLCMNVGAEAIRHAVEQGAETFEEVCQRTGCARSCSMCAGEIKGEIGRTLAARDGRRGGGKN